MDYRSEVARIRSKRDRELARIRAQAARDIEQLRERRDAQIHRLRELGMTCTSIAQHVGYSYQQVSEIANGTREANNARRRAHWHVIQGGKAA